MTMSTEVSRDAGRRPARRVALVVAITAVFTLLCCGGGVGSFFLTDPSAEGDTLLTADFSCGEPGRVAITGRLPTIPSYGQARMRNAAIIINVGAELEVPERGWVIAVATAMQESSLVNLPHLGEKNDHDSVGLFQQRPSQGWGTPEQLQDPEYAAGKFYEKLLTISGWQQMPLTVAAQKVQISAYPDAYAKHEPNATRIVNVLTNGAARAAVGVIERRCASPGEVSASGWTVPVRAFVVSGFRTASRPNHHGVDLATATIRHAPIRAATAGQVITAACDGDSTGQRCQVEGSPSTRGCGWYVKVRHAADIVTMYCHMQNRPTVKVGQEVAAGQELGSVGNSGNSSGPHLHFEVHDPTAGGPVDPVIFMRDRGAPLGAEG